MGGAGVVNPSTGEMHFYNTEGPEGVSGGGEISSDRNAIERDALNRDMERAAMERAAMAEAENARYGKYGSVDPNRVAAGTAYGIDAGARTHGLSDFLTGFKAAPVGLGGRVVAGLGSLAMGSPGSSAVNGGGWGNDIAEVGYGIGGPSSQSSQSRAGGESGGTGGMSSLRPVASVSASAPVPSEPVYTPFIPIQDWMNLSIEDRQKAMAEFWARF